MTDLTERGFASLGTNYLHYQQVTRELARGNSSTSRLMCIAMGYFDAFCTVAFLSGLGEPVLGRFGKAISETAISHGTVLKVSMRCSCSCGPERPIDADIARTARFLHAH
jgi:hypothetical protein